MAERITVLVAEPQRLLRAAISSAIAAQPDMEVVAEVSRGPEAEIRCMRTGAQIALLAEDLPPTGGLATARALRGTSPTCGILLLAANGSASLVVEVCREGFGGYVTHGRSPSELANAIRAVHRGEFAMPRELIRPMVSTLLDQSQRRQEADRLLASLSARQRGVLNLLVQGANNQAIADAFGISPETARTHVQHVLTKLGVNSRVQAVAYALAAGLADPLPASGSTN